MPSAGNRCQPGITYCRTRQPVARHHYGAPHHHVTVAFYRLRAAWSIAAICVTGAALGGCDGTVNLLPDCCSSCDTTGFSMCPPVPDRRFARTAPSLFGHASRPGSPIATCTFDSAATIGNATTDPLGTRVGGGGMLRDSERVRRRGVMQTAEPRCTVPYYAEGTDSHIYLSILSPGHVGSSALAGLLATSPAVSTLCSAKVWQCEGEKVLMKQQYKHVRPVLSREVRNAMARGSAEYAVRPGSNETVTVGQLPWGLFFEKFRSHWNLSRPILLDKSPAFLSYGPEMAATLRKHRRRAAFLVLTRSACTMSTKRRDKFARNLKERAPNSTARLPNPQLHNYNRSAAMAVRTALELRRAGEHVLHVRYEDMMVDPDGIVARLLAFLPELRTLDPNRNGMSGYEYSGKNARKRAGLDDGRREESITWFQRRFPLANSCRRYPREWAPEMTALGYQL